ncbi:MAG: TraR/DksA C4-type zinc finger protein [Actinomycetota bacterium]|nr:TraR/DksA C4-type zinc finger protein [Actinomycetota bacterium]
MAASSASQIEIGEDDFLATQRAELHARRAAYREQADRLTAAVEELAQAGESPDIGDDDGFAEADPLSVERDRVFTLAGVARGRVEEIDAALARLDAGAYGMCRTCRRPIPIARLEAVPEATQCVTCGSGAALRRR